MSGTWNELEANLSFDYKGSWLEIANLINEDNIFSHQSKCFISI